MSVIVLCEKHPVQSSGHHNTTNNPDWIVELAILPPVQSRGLGCPGSATDSTCGPGAKDKKSDFPTQCLVRTNSISAQLLSEI
jgi:hypothetical protein